jgi:hypothetical protein
MNFERSCLALAYLFFIVDAFKQFDTRWSHYQKQQSASRIVLRSCCARNKQTALNYFAPSSCG